MNGGPRVWRPSPVDIPLLSGPGNYYVFVFAAPGSHEGRSLSPLTAALIQATRP